MTERASDTPRPAIAGMRIKRLIAQIHSWAGAIAFLLVFLITASGVLAGFVPELLEAEFGEAIISPEPPGEDAPYADIDVIVAAARAASSRPIMPVFVVMDRTRFEIGAAFVLGVPQDDSGDRFHSVAVDPYRGVALGNADILNSLAADVVHFHESLLLGEGGGITVTLIGVLMIAFVATGIYQWWPRRGRALAKAANWRLRGSGYAKLFKLHGLGGIWLAPLVLLWAWTGIYAAKPGWVANVLDDPNVPEAQGFDTACGAGSVGLGAAARIAQARHPDKRLTILQAGMKPGEPHQVILKASGDRNAMYGDTRVMVSRLCADDVVSYTLDRHDVLASLGAMNYSLHAGRTFGPFRVPLLLICGIGLLVLSVAGLVVWFKKTFPSRRR